MPRSLRVALLSTLFVVVDSMNGGLITPQPLDVLQREADLIVFGSASGSITVGEHSPGFSISVVRVIKGDPGIAGQRLNVHWENQLGELLQSGIPIAAAGDGIWFLKKSAPGLQVVPVVAGVVPFDRVFLPAAIGGGISSAYAYPADASASDKLAYEAAAAIEGLSGGYNYQLYELFRSSLGQMNSPILKRLCDRMWDSTSLPQQVLALSGFVQSGDVSRLPAAAASMDLSADPVEYGMLLFSIREQLRSVDSGGVIVLGNLSRNQALDPGLRRAVAHALSSVHSSGSMVYLAALLDDDDPEVRAEAIGGVAAFANCLPVQVPGDTASLAAFQLTSNCPYASQDTLANFAMGPRATSQNETSLRAFWKTWWAQNRGRLGL